MRLAMLPLLLVASGTPPARESGVVARIDYTLEYRPVANSSQSELGSSLSEAGAGSWHIQVAATGLPRSSQVELYLQNWGEWLEVPDYLADVHCDPPLAEQRAQSEGLRVEIPKSWNGELNASYTIKLPEEDSERARNHGLLPRRVGASSVGYAVNSLASVHVDGDAIGAVVGEA